MRVLKNIYRTYIDVIGYVKTDKKRYDNENIDGKEQNDVDMANEGDEVPDDERDQGLNNEHDAGFTEDQVKQFRELAQDPQVYDKLIDALAPSIWECHDVKKGILCQLFGGCSKSF